MVLLTTIRTMAQEQTPKENMGIETSKKSDCLKNKTEPR
ncbi:hypothetical protein P872_11130 [Rhodonellum psychrophilum GCM71 = DSM 17998]|uniref:Uncharacterized protein n=1 Tax=Rhodonellum psychrophilum GCM71 = DSM 17998 TaxID=1123057 RepID=U5BYA5_9BACT|nr:hypothetical protein P872_11130 [Rhodonellum psychrophilum GCM71 = DSM 17998]